MSNGNRVVTIWILLGLVAVACSTSTPIDSQAGEEGGTVDLADGTAPADGQEQDSSGEEQDPRAENDGLVSAGGIDQPEQSPPQAPSFVARPDPYEVIPFAPPPTFPVDPPAGATPEEHIGAMFADVAATILAGDRAINARMSDAFYSRTWKVIPEIVLSVFAAQGSLAGDVLGTIEAYARVGAAAGYGPEASAYFEARASAAAGLAEIGGELYDAAAAGRQLGTVGRSCVAAGLVDEPDECSFDREAEAILANLVEATGFDIELPDGFDDNLDPTIDLCAIWSDVVGSFNAVDLELLDLVVAGSTIDSSFLGRSECRDPEEGIDGGPEWDTGPGVDAFQNLYTRLVQTGSRLELDEAFYDDSSEAQYGSRVRDSALAHYTAIAETARRDLGSVQDPIARLALVSIAVVATDEAWSQAGALELGGTVGVFFDLLEACGDPDTADPVASCDPELQPYLERVFFGDSPPWSFTFTTYTESIEWQDVERDYELCSLWADAVSDVPEAVADALAFQMGVLDLDSTVGLEDCR